MPHANSFSQNFFDTTHCKHFDYLYLRYNIVTWILLQVTPIYPKAPVLLQAKQVIRATHQQFQPKFFQHHTHCKYFHYLQCQYNIFTWGLLTDNFNLSKGSCAHCSKQNRGYLAHANSFSQNCFDTTHCKHFDYLHFRYSSQWILLTDNINLSKCTNVALSKTGNPYHTPTIFVRICLKQHTANILSFYI